MVEFLIVGSENIAGSRIIVPVAVATVIPGVVVPVTGTVVTQGTISIGTVVAQVGTVAVSTVTSVVALGTIQNAPMVTVQGTVTAAIAATLEVGTIVVGVEGSVVVATVLNSPMVTVQGTVTTGDMGTVVVGTILNPVVIGSGTVTTESFSISTNVVASGTLGGSTAATLVTATIQNIVVDGVFGTMNSGSIQIAVLGFEVQTSSRSGTIVASPWIGGTIPSGIHIASQGPLGRRVVVSVNVVAGTALSSAVTANQSTWG